VQKSNQVKLRGLLHELTCNMEYPRWSSAITNSEGSPSSNQSLAPVGFEPSNTRSWETVWSTKIRTWPLGPDTLGKPIAKVIWISQSKANRFMRLQLRLHKMYASTYMEQLSKNVHRNLELPRNVMRCKIDWPDEVGFATQD
jgi:hypothetical protein